jgi:hypothetical protein
MDTTIQDQIIKHVNQLSEHAPKTAARASILNVINLDLKAHPLVEDYAIEYEDDYIDVSVMVCGSDHYTWYHFNI